MYAAQALHVYACKKHVHAYTPKTLTQKQQEQK